MIIVKDRDFNTVSQVFDTEIIEDKFEQDLETGISTYQFSAFKSDGLEIKVGSFLKVRDGDRILTFEVLETVETHEEVTVYAMDGGLDLIGNEIGPYQAPMALPLQDYFYHFLSNSGWEIGVNEATGRSLTLSWTGTDTAVSRLRQLAKRFGAEITYDIEWRDGKLFRRKVNFWKRVGLDKKVRLEYGHEVSGITKSESIENLATAIRAVGQEGITLDNYAFDDGRYFVNKGLLCDREAAVRWRRLNAKDGYIVKAYESEASTQKTLFDETLLQLKKRSIPEVQYEVEINSLPEDINIGDSVSIVDHDYKPSLIIDARASRIERSLAKPWEGKVYVTNVEERQDSIDQRVKALSYFLKYEVATKTELENIELTPGPPGPAGKTSYVHFAYSDNADGTGLTTVDNGQRYMGQYTDFIEADSTDETKYRWTDRWAKIDVGGRNYFRGHKFNEEITLNTYYLVGSFTQFYNQLTYPLESSGGKTFTISFEAISPSGPSALQVYNRNNDPKYFRFPSQYLGNVTTEWQKFSTTVTVTTHDVTNSTNSNRIEIYAPTKTGVKVRNIKVELGTVATDWTQAEEDRQADIDSKASQGQLSNLADQQVDILVQLEKKLEQKDLEELSSRFSNVEAGYASIKEHGEQLVDLTARTTQMALNLNESQAVINAISTNFTFNEDGLIIGRNGSVLQTRALNDRLEFIDAGKVVAYITNQQLYIVSGKFVEALEVGNHKFEKLGLTHTIISWVGEI